MNMVIAVISLAVLGVAVLLPNVLAIRFALLGGSGTGAVAGGAAPALKAARTARTGGRGLLDRGYMWKALSPLLFAVSVILAIALGGIAGVVVVSVSFLNLVLSFIGWGNYIPGKH